MKFLMLPGKLICSFPSATFMYPSYIICVGLKKAKLDGRFATGSVTEECNAIGRIFFCGLDNVNTERRKCVKVSTLTQRNHQNLYNNFFTLL